MAVINTNGSIPFSKHRNSNSKSLDLRDMAGNKIKGSLKAHFTRIGQKVQERYDLKQEAFKLLSIDQIKDIFDNPIRPQICSSTDKSALADVYFEKIYEVYDAYSIDELKEINRENIDDVRKLALDRCIQLKELKNKIQSKKDESKIQSDDSNILPVMDNISSSERSDSSLQASNS